MTADLKKKNPRNQQKTIRTNKKIQNYGETLLST